MRNEINATPNIKRHTSLLPASNPLSAILLLGTMIVTVQCMLHACNTALPLRRTAAWRRVL